MPDSTVDRILRLLDNGTQQTTQASLDRDTCDTCAHCRKAAPAKNSDFCGPCRSYLLEDSEIDPADPTGSHIVCPCLDLNCTVMDLMAAQVAEVLNVPRPNTFEELQTIWNSRREDLGFIPELAEAFEGSTQITRAVLRPPRAGDGIQATWENRISFASENDEPLYVTPGELEQLRRMADPDPELPAIERQGAIGRFPAMRVIVDERRADEQQARRTLFNQPRMTRAEVMAPSSIQTGEAWYDVTTVRSLAQMTGRDDQVEFRATARSRWLTNMRRVFGFGSSI